MRSNWIQRCARIGLGVGLLSLAGVGTSEARPAQPQRPPRPNRPTRIPRQSPTPVVTANPDPTPTMQPSSGGCPIPPSKIIDTRLWRLFWKYPGVTNDLTGTAAFRTPRDSNGIDPEHEATSLALVNSQGESIIAMPPLQFTRTGNGSWAASNDQGYVVLQAITGGYSLSFNFQGVEALSLPPDFYTTGGKLCFTVGDEGVFERFVCQIKPGGGFLCHE